MALPKILQVTVESMAAGGAAVARHDGQVIFIPGLAPGDRALIEISRYHATWAEGKVKALFKPGPARVEPGCGHYPRCGGCQWLHVSAAEQLNQKEVQAKAQLRKFPELEWAPTVAAEPGELRTRVRLHQKGGRLGFYSAGSRRIEPLASCPAMAPELSALLRPLQDWMRTAENTELIEDLQLDLDGDGKLAMLVRLERGDAKAAQGLLDYLPANLPFVGAAVAHGGGSTPLASRGALALGYALEVGERKLRIGYTPFTFVQSSHPLNRKLVAAALEWLGPPPARGAPLVDLFCGVGNFALPLAALEWKVSAIESGRLAITALQENAAAAKLVIDAKVGDALDPGVIPPAATLLLDPPRTGAPGLAAKLAASKPRRILYISCDAATLARDLGEFSANGFTPSRARVLDLFPSTSHYETMVELLRN